MKALPDHDYAALFPLMGEDDLAKLAADIAAKKGLTESIWRFEGKILDGRNRYRACGLAGVEPTFQDYEGDDPLGFVLSKNLHRRHLTESQRAMVAAHLAKFKVGDNQHSGKEGSGIPLPSQATAAELLSVSVDSVKAARKVVESGTPELVKAVDAGEVSVSAAAEVAKMPKAEQKKVVKQGPKAVQAKAKEQRAAKKKPTPAPEPAEEVEPEPEPVADADPGDVFVAEVESLCRDMDKVAGRVKAMRASPYAFSVHLDSAASQVEAARKTLWQGRPCHVCPYCRANEEVKPDCRACRGTNRVKASTYKTGVEAVGGGE